MPLSPGSAQMECEVASHQVDSAGDRCSSLKLKELWSCRGCRCLSGRSMSEGSRPQELHARNCSKQSFCLPSCCQDILLSGMTAISAWSWLRAQVPCDTAFKILYSLTKAAFSENGTRTYLLLKTPEANALSLTYVLSRLFHVSNGVGGTATQIEQLAFYMSFSYSWHLHLLQEIHDRCKSLLEHIRRLLTRTTICNNIYISNSLNLDWTRLLQGTNLSQRSQDGSCGCLVMQGLGRIGCWQWLTKVVPFIYIYYIYLHYQN